jgi:hypothetical protein
VLTAAGVLCRRRRKKYSKTARRASPTAPPIAPPAMAPILVVGGSKAAAPVGEAVPVLLAREMMLEVVVPVPSWLAENVGPDAADRGDVTTAAVRLGEGVATVVPELDTTMTGDVGLM